MPSRAAIINKLRRTRAPANTTIRDGEEEKKEARPGDGIQESGEQPSHEASGTDALEVKVLKEEPLAITMRPNPNYDARKPEVWEEELHAFILLVSSLLVASAAIIARHTQNPLIISSFLLGAALVTILQPYLGYDRWPTGYRLAETLFKRGMLEEWAYYSNKIPIIAILKNGVHLIVVLKRLGLKATLILTSSAGHVTLPTFNGNLRKIKMKKLRVLRRFSQDEWGLDDLKAVRISSQSCIVELIVPSVRHKEYLTFYKGKAVIIDIMSNPTVEVKPLDDIVVRVLEKAVDALYEPIGIPARRRRKIKVPKLKVDVRSRLARIAESRRRKEEEKRRRKELERKRKEEREREKRRRRKVKEEGVFDTLIKIMARRD